MLRQAFSLRTSVLATLVVLAGLLVGVAIWIYATHPIITDRFIADAGVYPFGDRVYLYVTDDSDNSGSAWDSKDWRAYSSTDLVHWIDHGQIFKVGPGGFAWASNYAWAPAAAYKNGYYYLYLPVDAANPDSISKIGVARSTSPSSGFVDALGAPLILEGREANAGTECIDPFVFMDDDGQAYLYFGGRQAAKVVKLNADMLSLNGPIQSLALTDYAESMWVHKRNGIYYLSYSTGWPGPIAYATGSSPLGPFTYQGILLDYVNISTNHQGILNYNDQWFLFYHRSVLSGGGPYRRSVLIDCMYYNADGTLRMVQQTAGGVTSTSCKGN